MINKSTLVEVMTSESQTKSQSVVFPWVLQSCHSFSMKDWSDHIYMGPVGPWNICPMLLTYHAGPMATFINLSNRNFLGPFGHWVLKFLRLDWSHHWNWFGAMRIKCHYLNQYWPRFVTAMIPVTVRRLLMVIAVTINTRWWPLRKVGSHIDL